MENGDENGSIENDSGVAQDSFNDVDFTEEHKKEIDAINEEINKLVKKNNALEEESKKAQEIMEKASAETEDQENRAKRISDSMGPLKDKYYMMKNAYVSIESLKNMVEEYISGRLQSRTNRKGENPFVRERIKTLQELLTGYQADELELDNEISKIKKELGE